MEMVNIDISGDAPTEFNVDLNRNTTTNREMEMVNIDTEAIPTLSGDAPTELDVDLKRNTKDTKNYRACLSSVFSRTMQPVRGLPNDQVQTIHPFETPLHQSLPHHSQRIRKSGHEHIIEPESQRIKLTRSQSQTARRQREREAKEKGNVVKEVYTQSLDPEFSVPA